MNFFRRLAFRLRNDSPAQFLYRIVRSLILKYESCRKSALANFRRLTAGKRFILKEILGSKMYLDLDDHGLSRDLLAYGIREPFSTQVMKEALKPGQVVVDVGANIGYYALLEAKTVGEKGRVYCLEPAPENVEILRRNIAANGYENIEVLHAAAGAASKEGKLYLSSSHNQHAMLAENVRGAVGSVPVQMVSLDDFMRDKPFPSLVRMDVEGYELDILRGMKDLFATGKPMQLFIEIHCFFLKEKVLDLLAILKKAGFRVKVGTWERTVISGGKPMQSVFDYCSDKLGVGDVGLFWPTMDELEKRLAGEEELSVTVFFERP